MFRCAERLVTKLADFRGTHGDAHAGAGGKQVLGLLATANSLGSYVEGWMRAMQLRGTPLPDKSVALVRELVNRSLPRVLPSKVARSEAMQLYLGLARGLRARLPWRHGLGPPGSTK